MRFDPSTRLREARESFFRQSGFAPDGGYSAATVTFRMGPVAFRIPNTTARKRAVPLHDLHHILTGYDTDWRGEAEIAAWELGSGCESYFAAWFLNLMAFQLGLFIAPLRMWRAFRLGRAQDSLYRQTWQENWLEETVGSMTARLGLDRVPTSLPVLDAVLFLACALPTVVGFVVVSAATYTLLT